MICSLKLYLTWESGAVIVSLLCMPDTVFVMKVVRFQVLSAALSPKILLSAHWVETESLLHQTRLIFPSLSPATAFPISISPFPPPSVWCITSEGGRRIEYLPFLPSPVKFQSQATVKGGIVSPWWGMPLHRSSKKRLHLARNLEASREV